MKLLISLILILTVDIAAGQTTAMYTLAIPENNPTTNFKSHIPVYLNKKTTLQSAKPVSHVIMICGSCGSDNPANKPLTVVVAGNKDIIITDTEYFMDPRKSVYIETVNVSKGTPAMERFGEAGKNGVILITIKKEYLKKFLSDRKVAVHRKKNNS
jgi:hypothetical protein